MGGITETCVVCGNEILNDEGHVCIEESCIHKDCLAA